MADAGEHSVRCAICVASTDKVSRLYGDGGAHAGAGHRCKRHDVQPGECVPAAASSGARCEGMVVVSSVNPDQQFQPDTNPVSPPNYFAWSADKGAFSEMSRGGSVSHRQHVRTREAAGSSELCGRDRPITSRCSARLRNWAGRLWQARTSRDMTMS